MDELDKEADEAHQQETHGHGLRDLDKFWCQQLQITLSVWLGASIDELDRIPDELSWLVQKFSYVVHYVMADKLQTLHILIE